MKKLLAPEGAVADAPAIDPLQAALEGRDPTAPVIPDRNPSYPEMGRRMTRFMAANYTPPKTPQDRLVDPDAPKPAATSAPAPAPTATPDAPTPPVQAKETPAPPPDAAKHDYETAPSPKSAKEWDAWKSSARRNEEALKKQLADAEAARKALEERPVPKPTEPREEDAALIKQLQEEKDAAAKANQELLDRLTLADHKLNPNWQAKYVDGAKKLVDAAKAAAGDKATEVEKWMSMPEGQEKDAAWDDIATDLPSTRTASRISNIADQLEALRRQEADDEGKVAQYREVRKAQLTNDQKAAVAKQQAERKSAFEAARKDLTDLKDGLVIFQKKEGPENEAWNKMVEDTLKDTEALWTNPNLSMIEVARATHLAAAFPRLLAAYNNSFAAHEKQVKELQAQLDGLKAAQPPGAQPTATTERKPRPVEVTKDPHQWGRERARNMRAAMSEAVPAQFSNPPARQF